MNISSHWPTEAAACFSAISFGRSTMPSLDMPALTAPEVTRITSLPIFLMSLSTIASRSILRKLIPPPLWVSELEPILMTMRFISEKSFIGCPSFLIRVLCLRAAVRLPHSPCSYQFTM